MRMSLLLTQTNRVRTAGCAANTEPAAATSAPWIDFFVIRNSVYQTTSVMSYIRALSVKRAYLTGLDRNPSMPSRQTDKNDAIPRHHTYKIG